MWDEWILLRQWHFVQNSSQNVLFLDGIASLQSWPSSTHPHSDPKGNHVQRYRYLWIKMNQNDGRRRVSIAPTSLLLLPDVSSSVLYYPHYSVWYSITMYPLHHPDNTYMSPTVSPFTSITNESRSAPDPQYQIRHVLQSALLESMVKCCLRKKHSCATGRKSKLPFMI